MTCSFLCVVSFQLWKQNFARIAKQHTKKHKEQNSMLMRALCNAIVLQYFPCIA